MNDHTFFETGDDTYQGIAFTPSVPGCDQVEVIASLDHSTNEESAENLEACRRYARLLHAAPDLLRELAELVELLDSDAEVIKTKYAHEVLSRATGVTNA